MKMDHIFKKTSLVSILGTAFLSILLVVPLTDNFVDASKTYLLFFSSILVFLLFVIKALREKAIKVTVSTVSGPLLAFGLAALASTFFTANYPVESLLGIGGVYIASTLLAILGGSLIPKDSVKSLVDTVTAASVGLVIFTILQMVGYGPAQMINRLFSLGLPTDLSFNIAGSTFVSLQIIFVTLVGILTSISTSKKMSKFHAISLPILLIGAGIFAWSLLPGKPTQLTLPPLDASWSVMLDTIRNPRSALIGAGPSAYSNAYTAFKPIWMNNTEQWSVVFSQASNFPLTLLSTMGAIGLITWLYFVFRFTRLHKISLVSSKPLTYMIGASLLLQLLFPINTVMLTIQAVAIACLIANEKHRLPLLQMQALKFKVLNKDTFGSKSSKAINIPLYLSVGVGLLGAGTLFYFTGRAYYAGMLMGQSSKALAANNLPQAYELQQRAVTLNPYLDIYRRRYASTNALIAIALSNKADITDIEREQVSALLQQSVREARAATTLDSVDSQNWSSLAQVYSSLIGISDDAVQWAVQSYTRAIETNPNNPALRIDLAGIFSGQGNYEQAVSIINQAINLKPDLAGSHYNLGLVLERVEQPQAYRNARISYQRALVLLEADSEEYTIVNKRIEELEKFMEEQGISLEPEQQAPNGSQLQNTGGQNGTQAPTTPQEATEVPEIEAPSIIEQNLEGLEGPDEITSPSEEDLDLTPPATDPLIEEEDPNTSQG